MNWLITIIAIEALVELLISSEILISIRIYLTRLSPNFLGKLFTCGYCMSVWVAIILVLISGNYIGDLIIKILALHRLSNVVHEAVTRWFKRLPWVVLTGNMQQDNRPSEVIMEASDESRR